MPILHISHAIKIKVHIMLPIMHHKTQVNMVLMIRHSRLVHLTRVQTIVITEVDICRHIIAVI